MEFSDPLKGALGGWLAKKKSIELQEGASRKTTAMRQHEYAVARLSILGEFSSQPITSCQQCIVDAKAARRKERLDLVSRHMLACRMHGTIAARLRQDVDEVEYMRCAKHVYLANDPNAPADLRDNPPPGFKNVSPEQLQAMGLKETMLQPEKSNFRAAVYIKYPAVWGPAPKPNAVVAFRGSTPAEEDWQNNFAQDGNKESRYYSNAVLRPVAVTFTAASARQSREVRFISACGSGTRCRFHNPFCRSETSCAARDSANRLPGFSIPACALFPSCGGRL